MEAEKLFREAQELAAAGHHGKAASLFKQLVAETVDPRFHIAYGICLQRLGHWDVAISQLQRGIELRPHYCEGDARLMLAESFLRTGQKKKAIEQWQMVSAMEPEYPSYEAVPNEAKKMLVKHAA